MTSPLSSIAVAPLSLLSSHCYLGLSWVYSGPHLRRDACGVGGRHEESDMDSGVIDGFFIDITPQTMANQSGSADGADPVDPYVRKQSAHFGR